MSPVERIVDPRELRMLILEQAHRARVGGAGSALSIADIVAAIYGSVLAGGGAPRERERVVLSKGHAALALYAALRLTGAITAERLDTFCASPTLLGVHPDHRLDGIEFSTGSLGHGLSFAAGDALAARIVGSSRRTFAILSDGECNEGSVWEAAMFAAHRRLAGLVAIVDVNGQQSYGYTRDVLWPSGLDERWRGFGWDVHDVDGHDPAAIAALIATLDTTDGPPHVLLARTVFGSGVPFMEGQPAWHYRILTDDDLRRARQALSAAAAARSGTL
jgi:transketolase